MKLLGWLLLIGGSLLSVMGFFMLVMQIALWLTGGSSWPPMGLSVFWDVKLKTGWAGLDQLFNSHIPTGLIAIAALIGLGLAFLGMKTIEKIDRTLERYDGAAPKRRPRLAASFTIAHFRYCTQNGPPRMNRAGPLMSVDRGKADISPNANYE